MWLLPRTELELERTNVWCDKIGEVHPDDSLTHMIFDEGDGLWKLQQRQTISGQDEMLATLSCAGHPKLNDHWHLVHRCFGWRGVITMDRWTMHDYKMKITQADPSRLDELSRELKVMRPAVAEAQGPKGYSQVVVNDSFPNVSNRCLIDFNGSL